MSSSVGMCLLRQKKISTALLIEIFKPHSSKNFAVSTGYRWMSLDKADRLGPDFHIELKSVNSASLTPFDDSGKSLIMTMNSSGVDTLP